MPRGKEDCSGISSEPFTFPTGASLGFSIGGDCKEPMYKGMTEDEEEYFTVREMENWITFVLEEDSPRRLRFEKVLKRLKPVGSLPTGQARKVGDVVEVEKRLTELEKKVEELVAAQTARPAYIEVCSKCSAWYVAGTQHVCIDWGDRYNPYNPYKWSLTTSPYPNPVPCTNCGQPISLTAAGGHTCTK